MDSFLFFLERHAKAILVFFILLALIFVVIRPAMRFMIEYLHKRKIEEMRKEAVSQTLQKLDTEMEEMLQKAANMGLTDQERIRHLAQNNPERAKDLILQWMHGENTVSKKTAGKSSEQ